MQFKMDASKRFRECKNLDVRREFVFNLSSNYYGDPVRKSDQNYLILVQIQQIQVKVTLDLKPEGSIFPLSAKSINSTREILKRQLPKYFL